MDIMDYGIVCIGYSIMGRIFEQMKDVLFPYHVRAKG